MESFSDWLLKELKSRDMSQSDLARLANLGNGTISNIMNGTRKVGQDTLVKIAHALRLPRELLFEKAGILSPQTPETELINQIVYTAKNLSQDDQNDILEYARLREKLSQEKANAKKPGRAAFPTPTQPR